MTTLNERREVLGTISLDAWFVPCKEGYKLHVHLNFDEQNYGGEPESPVRFKLRLRKAQLVLVIPASEPVKYDRDTIFRGDAKAQTRVTEEKSTSDQGQSKANAKMSGLGISAGLSGTKKSAIGAKKKLSGKRSAINVEQKLDNITLQNIWQMSADGALKGPPWDAKQKPLLVLQDTRGKKVATMEPRVWLEVYCVREGLLIEEIELKSDPNKPLLDSTDKKQRRRIAAAESYIRNKLIETELQVFNEVQMAEMFTRIRLANVPCVVKGE